MNVTALSLFLLWRNAPNFIFENININMHVDLKKKRNFRSLLRYFFSIIIGKFVIEINIRITMIYEESVLMETSYKLNFYINEQLFS